MKNKFYWFIFFINATIIVSEDIAMLLDEIQLGMGGLKSDNVASRLSLIGKNEIP